MEMPPDGDPFWAPRRCQREPIPEIFHAAALLDRAAAAHLLGDAAEAEALLIAADMPEVSAYTESLWGAEKNNPDQWRYHRRRAVPGAPPSLAKDDRIPVRMPNKAGKRSIIAQWGCTCAFCGIPVIRSEVRKIFVQEYPAAVSWGETNGSQHAAFQCMWLQFDHVLPHARGGDNGLDNVVTTCAPCNYGRGSFTLEEYGLMDPRLRAPLKTSWDGLERVLPEKDRML